MQKFRSEEWSSTDGLSHFCSSALYCARDARCLSFASLVHTLDIFDSLVMPPNLALPLPNRPTLLTHYRLHPSTASSDCGCASAPILQRTRTVRVLLPRQPRHCDNSQFCAHSHSPTITVNIEHLLRLASEPISECIEHSFEHRH